MKYSDTERRLLPYERLRRKAREKRRGERGTDKVRKYRENVGSGGRIRGRGRTGWGGREGKIKAGLYSLMWLLYAGSSQLLHLGLLHLHLSLKIAAVIIYLAGARHPALCSQRIVFFFFFTPSKSV